MPTPAFNPNGSYDIPAFDPNASYEGHSNELSTLTSNPHGEGTYGIKTKGGDIVKVPYSKVPSALDLQGNSLDSGDEERYKKDAASDPHRATYWNALTNPVGSGAASGVSGDVEQAGGRAISGITAPLRQSPLATARGVVNSLPGVNPLTGQVNQGPLPGAVDQFKHDYSQNKRLAVDNAVGDVLGTVEGGRLAGAATEGVSASPSLGSLNTALPNAVQRGVLPSAWRAAKNTAGKAALLGKTPEAAYESALKPSTTLSADQRASIVQTGLAEGVPVSKGGMEKLGDLIDQYNQKIADTINADPNRPIDPQAVASRADQVVPRFSNQVNANGDLAAIQASRQQFLAEQGARPGTPATPPQPTGLLDAQGRPIMNAGTPAQPPQPAPPMGAAQAQAMKQGTYRVLKGKFGEQGSAAVEAQKSLARGLKEEIAQQFPEINDLNAQESKLLDLQPVLERAVNRISNHQAIGIGTPVAGAAAKAVTGSGSVGVVATTLKAVLDNPMVKSRLAIAVSKASKIPMAQASARVAAYASALGSAASVPLAYSSGDNPTQPTTQQP